MRRFHRLASALLVMWIGLLASGCLPGLPVVEQPTSTPTAAPPPTSEPGAVVEPASAPVLDNGSVTTLIDVRLATIRIVSKGVFVEPGERDGQTGVGSGSGFMIDPSGIAVTNNHVVTGAATIEVYIHGEDRPRNARVLGVAECSDLAVLQIEGEDFRYLEWHQGEIAAGMEVFTAGFPRGDREYTITKGVISKQRANGQTPWASVEWVVEHDAVIRPGSSGGPLVTADGRVVAVNYAVGRDGGPYYAIARDEALALIDRLRNGENVTSLGLNGLALRGERISGIWASSVRSGSELDRAGVKPGDFITRLEGLALARDGTMADYCQILRSRNPGDVLGIEVYRPSTQQLLEGQVNGRELQANMPPTPTPQPTAEPTPTPAPVAPNIVAPEFSQTDIDQLRAAYLERFEQARGSEIRFETFDNWQTKHFWNQTNTAEYAARYNDTGGIYHLTLKVANRPAVEQLRVYQQSQFQMAGPNYLIEAAVNFNGQAAVSAGVTFDGQPNSDRIFFLLNSDGGFSVVTLLDGLERPEYSLRNVPTDAIQPGTNRVQVLRTSEGSVFYINHTAVAMMVNPPFSGGTVGLAAVAAAGAQLPLTVFTDDFRLRPFTP